jgi:hypothetical protein
MFGKKTLTLNEFGYGLLSLLKTWEERFRNLFVNELGFEGNDKVLNVEVKILSLWIITLALPNDQYRDLIHMLFCKEYGFSKEQTDLFLQETDVRYRTYFEAFNMWQKTPESGHMIGSAIIETILNGNVGYSPKNDPLPLVSADDAAKVFVHFAEKFKATLGLIGSVRDEYRIEG